MKRVNLLPITKLFILLVLFLLTSAQSLAYTDTNAPTLSISKPSGSVNPGDAIVITAYDSSGINHIGYAWDDESTTPAYPSNQSYTTYSKTINVPNWTGTHTLKFYAKDNSYNYNFTGWVYRTYDFGSNDTTAPSLSVSPSSGTIEYGDTIKVTASDSSGINHIGYAWDDNATTPVYSNTATISVPSSSGSHTLKVYAKDNSINYNYTGWKNYYFTIQSSNDNDTTAPSLSVSPNSGTLEYGETIRVTASDSSGINHIGYAWDDGATTPVYSDTATIPVPSSSGSHTLKVYAKDDSSNFNSTGWKNYYYTIDSGNNSDNTAPSLSVNPSSGTLQYGDTIKITASDSSGINHIGYAWDDNATTPVYSDTATIHVPDLSGSHTLKVYAKDDSTNYNYTGWKNYYYTIESSQEDDTSAPSITVSPDGGSIDSDESIKITAQDDSGIDYIKYAWDDDTYTYEYSSSVYIDAPSDSGEHTLYVYARDDSSKHNTTSRHSYDFDVDSNSNSDNSAPSITVSPSGGDIDSDESIKITAQDDSGIDYIKYAWDDDTYTYEYSSSVYIDAPSDSGEHTLYVYARDDSSDHNTTSRHSYDFDVDSNSGSDTSAPSVTVDPDSGTIYTDDTIEITASDRSGIDYIKYAWDDASYTTKYVSSIDVDVPNSTGSHTLYVYARDDSSDHNTSNRQSFRYTIKSGHSSSDSSAPSLSVSPSSGTLSPDSSVITIKASDSSGINEIGYYWDSSSTTRVSRSTVTITTPGSTGRHTLHVYAEDDSPNNNRTSVKSYTYTIDGDSYYEEFPGSGETGTINPAVRSLRVELRNSDNKLRYEEGQDITYYLDYFNGLGSKVSNVEVSMDIPSGFSVTNYYDGNKSGNSIVWSIGTLQSLQSGRLQVKMKCSNAGDSGKEVILNAYIREDESTKDHSALLNYIYEEGSTGYHTRFIAGYSDGTFRPEKGITRAEFATMLVRLFNIDATSSTYRSNTYRDLSKKHWAYNAILACTHEGLFGGYEDGTFRPEAVVTRAEFAAVLVNRLKIDTSVPVWIHATDIRSHWAMNAMEELNRFNILVGYSDDTFKPNNKITRAEAVTLLNRVTYRGALENSRSPFKDVSSSHWASSQISEASKNHSFTRTSSGDENL